PELHPGSSGGGPVGRDPRPPGRDESAEFRSGVHARDRHEPGALRHLGPRRDGAAAPGGDPGRPRGGLLTERARDDGVHAPRVPPSRRRSAQPVPGVIPSPPARGTPARGRPPANQEARMKTAFRLVAAYLAALALIAALALLGRPSTAQGKRYVCAPCGLPCDADVADQPGTCPKCGMPLVEQDQAAAEAAARKKVGILIFNGVQIIDYSGPYEIFQGAGFDVYTVAASKDPITTVAGMTVVPRYSLGDAPQPDLLVVPGGGIGSVLSSEATIKWVRETAAHTVHTMSVCNG